jgi:hypothetical protein
MGIDAIEITFGEICTENEPLDDALFIEQFQAG